MNSTASTIKLCILSVLMFAGTSCTDHYESLNIPPDQIVAENVDEGLLGQMFAYSQYHNMLGLWFGWYQNLYPDTYAQYFSVIHPGFTSDQFEEAGVHTAHSWMTFYDHTASQLGFVENYSQENGLVLQNAIARIWRVHAYHRITDDWGPIVYSQVNSGETSVAYDSQEDVYMDFFTTLDDAVSILEEHRGENVFGSHDLLYGGNIDQWITFANSLRLRLAMRIVYVEPEMAQNEAEKAVAAGVITDNADNALVSTTANSLHPLATITYHEEFRASASLHSLLLGYDDPRLDIYLAEVWEGGGYKGLRNGLPSAEVDRTFLSFNYSNLGNRWRPLYSGQWGEGGVNPPARVMSAAEVFFLRAEGALRNWDMGGTAQELYNEGIRASLSEDRINASAGEIDAYINSTNTPAGIDDPWDTPPMTDIPVLYQPAADFESQLEQIITQKWLALYPDGWEAWAERRRTGYPVGYAILHSINPNVSETGMMRRRTFSSDEKSDNAVAVQNAVELLNGPDRNDTRVWWDAKPISDYPVPAGAQ